MVVALVTDLLFSSKIREQAHAHSRELKVCRTSTEFEEALKSGPDQIIVDLNSSRVDPLPALDLCKKRGLIERVTAFCSHVDRELHRQAEEVGVKQLYARSQFVKEIHKLMQLSSC